MKEPLSTANQEKNDEHPDVFQLRMERTIKRNCSKCGRNHKFKDCPTFGKTCHKCERKNHFSNMCRSKNYRLHINALTNSVETGDKISNLDDT